MIFCSLAALSLANFYRIITLPVNILIQYLSGPLRRMEHLFRENQATTLENNLENNNYIKIQSLKSKR